MFSIFKDVEENNTKSFKTFLDNKIEDINNVDVSLCNMIEIDIERFSITKDEEEYLFNHLLVSKTIAQMALNIYRDNSYYIHNTFYNHNLLEIIHDEEDRKVYDKQLQFLLKEKKCQKESFLEIFKSSIIIYLIVCKKLQNIEEIKSSVCCDASSRGKEYKGKKKYKVEQKYNSNNNSNSLKAVESKEQRNELVIKESSVSENWKCNKCTMLNTYIKDKCIACNEYGPHYNKWRCKICTFINEKYERNCDACNILNPYVENSVVRNVVVNNVKDDKKCKDLVKKKDKNTFKSKKIESGEWDLESDQWNCSSCSLKNSVCEGYGPLHDKWRCDTCSKINGNSDIKCNDCHKISPFIKLCPQCDISIINIKYNKICKECATLEEERNKQEIIENIENNINMDQQNIEDVVEEWSCSKCSLRNLFDIERCSACDNVGPHYNKWRCSKCTMINGRLDIQCSGCHEMNTFIEKCSLCDVSIINIKYNKICEKCETFDKVKNELEIKTLKEENIKKEIAKEVEGEINNVEEWSCSKCSLRNLFDKERCSACDNVGPHYNKWRCSKCTAFNDNSTILCKVCENIQYKRKKSEDNLLYSHINAPLEDHKFTNNYNSTLSSKNNQYKRRFCEKCSNTLVLSENNLCYKCNVDYYICPNYTCGRVVGPRKTKCDLCYVNKDHNKDYKEECGGSWTCSWKLCKHINKEGDNRCRICHCYKDDKDRVKCTHCGYIGYNIGGKCDKCSRDCEGSLKYTRESVENQKKKWKCPYRKCGYLNEEYHTFCRECLCDKDVLYGRVKCINCGYIDYGHISTKCYKC